MARISRRCMITCSVIIARGHRLSPLRSLRLRLAPRVALPSSRAAAVLGASLVAALAAVGMDRVAPRHAPARMPSARALLLFLVPALVALACGLVAGLTPAAALAAAATVSITQVLALWPYGLVRSGYALRLALFLSGGVALIGVFAAAMDRRDRGRGPWAFGALLLALIVQGVAATSPLMVVSDAVFHANNLARVAHGDLFLTSVTQHARPFRFPYGVS